MRVLILADLHHDFWADSPDDLARLRAGFQAVGPVDAAILAGDVSNKVRVRWKQAAQTLDAIVARDATYVFPGNHDYYAHRIDGEDRMATWAHDLGWTWAQRQAITLDRVRFLCATLWTNLTLGNTAPHNGATLASRMNDYRAIRVERGGFRKLRPEDTARIHDHHLAFLAEGLATPFDGPTAVVTHHAPHPGVLTQRDGVYDAAYASDLSTFLSAHQAPHPRAWFFGHAHGARPLTLPGWSLRPHSLGYPHEGMDPAQVLPGFVINTHDLHAPQARLSLHA